MPAEQTPPGVPTHRPLPPLPSVDIPLLRDERRASKKQQLVRTVALSLGAIVLIVAAFIVPRFLKHDDRGRHPGVVPPLSSQGDAPVDQTGMPPLNPNSPARDSGAQSANLTQHLDAGAAPVVSPPIHDDTPPVAIGATTRETHAFGNAGGFQPALLAAGASRAETDELTTALDHVIDFRHCQPEDQLTFERDGAGKLLRFQYRKDRIHIYEAVRDATGHLRGQQVQVPITRTRVAKGGHVAGSLGDALEALGMGRTLVGAFVDTFAGKVNFGTHTRAGDSFRVIVDEERVDGDFLRWGTVHALEYSGERAGTHRAFYYEPHGGEADFYDEEGRSVHGGWLRMPLVYDHISSPFDPHRMHPVLHRVMPHTGVDLSAGTGTPVWAAAAGTVTWVGDRGANGNLVTLHHQDGFDTFYCHLSRFAPGLRTGMEVHQRQLIGYVGTTGRSTGPHLHFGLQHHGHFVDPMHELNGPGQLMPAAALPAFHRLAHTLNAELAHIDLAPAPTPAHGTPPPSDEGTDSD